jgi:hypothetical protein
MFRGRWGQTVPCWIGPWGSLQRTSPPSGRTLPFHSCRMRLPPPPCQPEAHRPRSRPRSYPVATASGASAGSPTARACGTQSFIKRTGTTSEIQILFIPARSLSFLRSALKSDGKFHRVHEGWLRPFCSRSTTRGARHRHATASLAVARGAQRKKGATLKWSSGRLRGGASDAVGAAVRVHGSQHWVELRTTAQADVFRSSPKERTLA